MPRKVVLFGVLGLLVGCSVVVKPNYIDPEEDLSQKIEQGRQDLQEHPSLKKTSMLLGDSLLYYDRIQGQRE